MTQLKRTPLYEAHRDAGGKLVDFAGWEMPVNYGSQIEEHHSIRKSAGMFDVSHMTLLDIEGPNSGKFLSRLLANDISKANVPGGAVYSCMLNDQGGIIDDLIAYSRGTDRFRLIVNAGTRDKDIAWISQHLPDEVEMNERSELALIAVQGPQALTQLQATLGESMFAAVNSLKRFSATELTSTAGRNWFIARTGYTGEDGVEIALPADDAVALWAQLQQQGTVPCGLGARDTLRLEAGMNLYGSDMDENVTPLESGLAWTVALTPEDRDFIGRAALEHQRATGKMRSMKGVILDGRGVLRGGQQLYSGDQLIGTVTSGTFSPTLQKSIAFARVDSNSGDRCDVQIRDRRIPASIVKTPFVKDGQSQH